MSIARWSLLSKVASKARSSHALSITHDGILAIYGGELLPRTPIDASATDTSQLRGCLHTFNLGSSLKSQDTTNINAWATLSPSPLKSNFFALPQPRVGAAMVWDKHTSSFYLWGGRGGPDMTPLDQAEAGPWRGVLSASNSVGWEKMTAVNDGASPEPRSYHGAVLSGNKLFIHGGCPASGRLNTLHSFDLSSREWKALASAPGPARGGMGLATVTLPNEGATILRFGGFAGYELGSDHTIDIYNISFDTWQTVVASADPTHGYPGPRSVQGFVPFHTKSSLPAVALLYHGEREPSSAGHAGAGIFWDDVWVLNYFPSETTGEFAWKKLQVVGKGEVPEGRGWFPGGSYVGDDGETKVVMCGGLLTSNQRSDELWLLEVE